MRGKNWEKREAVGKRGKKREAEEKKRETERNRGRE